MGLALIAEATDPLKAAKAAYAASLIGGPAAIELLRVAARHHDPQVRIAVADGLKNLAAAAPTDLVMNALNDPDDARIGHADGTLTGRAGPGRRDDVHLARLVRAAAAVSSIRGFFAPTSAA
ncbi:HEAT repeat domain-containing protein [uncultured Thiodictyon sp.]|uniref:HEAT repeat domain-containing protein n=1 Tax=uncultured Thiodictyon sp. TaxID=1846217 RepID=UPI0025DA6F5B|nr:HEAT repeat domain-containing protein [uncultured Thiodictyon sp.]